MRKISGISKWLLTSALLLSCTLPVSAAASEAVKQNWKKLEKQFTQELKELGVIGAATALVTGNEITLSNYYGLADKEKTKKVDAKTIFHWASITKTLTGIAVMQLRDRGLLKLDDPIIKYIPELKSVHNPYGDMKDITLRNLMNHTAGFRAPTWPWRKKDWQPHSPTKWQQLVSMFPYTEIAFKPGSQFSYSNPGIIFLGKVIEDLSGDDYEVYIDKNILKPLKMYDAYFDITPYHLESRRSNSYSIVNGIREAYGPEFNTGITVSNGGLNASVSDMEKYIGFLLNEPKYQAVYNRILKRSSLEQMWSKNILVDTNDKKEEQLGLSFFSREYLSTQFVGHTGSQQGFVSFIYFNSELQRGAITVLNTHTYKKDKESNYKSLSRDSMAKIRDIYFDSLLTQESK